jgi:hypothetical protein
MDAIDWSKAGKRLRDTPRTPAMGGRNPDWNDRLRRWKTAEEYAGEELTPHQVRERVPCSVCHRPRGLSCVDARNRAMEYPHPERVFTAGAARIAAGWKL